MERAIKSMKLSEKIKGFRTDRPSEWMMDEYQRDAEGLEEEIDRLQARVAELGEGLSEALEWNWIDHVSAIEEGKYSDIQDVADRLTLLLQHDRNAHKSLAARDARVKVEALRDVIRKYTIKIVEDDFDRGYSQVLWEIQHDASRIEKEAGL